jgi:hypothetical protein
MLQIEAPEASPLRFLQRSPSSLLQPREFLLQTPRDLLQTQTSEPLPPRLEPPSPWYMQQSQLSKSPSLLDLQQSPTYLQQNNLSIPAGPEFVLQIHVYLQHPGSSGRPRADCGTHGDLDLQHGLRYLQHLKVDLQHISEGLLPISLYLQHIDRLLQHGAVSRPPARRCRRARILHRITPERSRATCPPASKRAARQSGERRRLRDVKSCYEVLVEQ